MKVHFLEVEPSEQEFFLNALSDQHELSFDESAGEVPGDAEAISCFIYTQVDRAFLEKHPSLKFVATRSTTFDHIDLGACQEAGICVSAIPTYGDYTVAEHTFALLLALARRLRQMMNVQNHFSYESLRGTELRSKTLGILGTGRIGINVVPIAKAFGMKVIAHDPKPREDAAKQLGFSYVSFDELLRQSDMLSLHACLNPSTYHIFNQAAFAKCKPGVMIVNTSRGALIDTEALLEALKQGIVSGAGLDVLEDETVMRKEAINVISDQIIERIHHQSEDGRRRDTTRIKQLQDLVRNKELLAREDVIFTPHVAFNSLEAIERINSATVENIRSFCSGKPANVCQAP